MTVAKCRRYAPYLPRSAGRGSGRARLDDREFRLRRFRAVATARSNFAELPPGTARPSWRQLVRRAIGVAAAIEPTFNFGELVRDHRSIVFSVAPLPARLRACREIAHDISLRQNPYAS